MSFFLFDQYAEPARARPQLWRLLLGVGLILLVYSGMLALMAVAAFPVLGPMEYFGWLNGLREPATPGHVIFVLLSFAGMALGVVLAAAACHFRGPGTLFGPAHHFVPDFLQTLLYLIPPYVVLGAWTMGSLGVTANLSLERWLQLLPLAVPLVLLQVSAEELIFRGYLPQQLAARFKTAWVWKLLPAVIFALLHYDARAGIASLAIVGGIFAFALAAMDLTARRGNLGPAIAWHFVNNCFALLFIAVDGTITGLALKVTPFAITDTAALLRSAAIDLSLIVLIWSLLKRTLRG